MISVIHTKVLIQCRFEYGLIPDGKEDIADADWLNVIERVEQKILNYCAIRKVPNALIYTWASMCVDYMRWWLASTENPDGEQGDDDEEAQGKISSVKIGDTQVNYGESLSKVDGAAQTKAKAIAAHTPYLDSLLMNYKQDLNNFRRMAWGRGYRGR